MSAALAPCSALASPSVWNGRCLSFDKPTVTSGSSEPPRVTIRSPSEVFVVDRLPKKYKFGQISSSELSSLSKTC